MELFNAQSPEGFVRFFSRNRTDQTTWGCRPPVHPLQRWPRRISIHYTRYLSSGGQWFSVKKSEWFNNNWQQLELWMTSDRWCLNHLKSIVVPLVLHLSNEKKITSKKITRQFSIAYRPGLLPNPFCFLFCTVICLCAVLTTLTHWFSNATWHKTKTSNMHLNVLITALWRIPHMASSVHTAMCGTG